MKEIYERNILKKMLSSPDVVMKILNMTDSDYMISIIIMLMMILSDSFLKAKVYPKASS